MNSMTRFHIMRPYANALSARGLDVLMLQDGSFEIQFPIMGQDDYGLPCIEGFDTIHAPDERAARALVAMANALVKA